MLAAAVCALCAALPATGQSAAAGTSPGCSVEVGAGAWRLWRYSPSGTSHRAAASLGVSGAHSLFEAFWAPKTGVEPGAAGILGYYSWTRWASTVRFRVDLGGGALRASPPDGGS